MPRPYGLHARNFPAPLREFVEVDYVDKLGPAEREWLAKFNDEYANGCFRADPLHVDVEQRREIWATTKRLKRTDVMSNARAANVLAYADGGDPWDQGPTPERQWLEPRPSPALELAVASLRSLLPALPSSPRRRVVMTKEHAAALKRVVQLNLEQQAGLKPWEG